MNISDQMLSAFLDAELAEHDMGVVREAISTEEGLADRLAELALVDEVVSNAYASINSRALPESVATLLRTEPLATTTAKLLHFPVWRSLGRHVREHPALAAGIAVMVSLGVVFSPDFGSMTEVSDLAAALSTARSGMTVTLDDDSQLTPQLTFVDQQGDYCRQYQRLFVDRGEQQIACHRAGQWLPVASVPAALPPAGNSYQTASGPSALEERLDQLMVGEPLDADAEAHAIDDNWTTKKQEKKP